MSYLSTAGVATFNKVDLDLEITDILNAAPLLNVLAARTCRSNVFYYTKSTAAPAAGFRAANDGVTQTPTTREKVTVTLGIMDASFAVDIAVAQSDERGYQHTLGAEALAALTQAMFAVEQQVIYGTDNDAAGFAGFADNTGLDATADSQVISAGGESVGGCSSVFAIKEGPLDCEVMWGQEGVIGVGELQIVERAGSATGLFPAYYHPICAWAGLKIGSVYSVARLANLDATTGHTLDDDGISDLLSLFPVGREPSYLVMSRRSRKQLQQSRTATNATGAPAPIPTESFNVPIVATDAMLNTENPLS